MPPETLCKEATAEDIAQAQAIAKHVLLTDQEITAIGESAIRSIRQEMGRQRAKNGGNKQHSEADFWCVFNTQLQFFSQGKNPTATEILRTAFPNDTAKATSIGNSARWQRVKKVYAAQVQNHPIMQDMLRLHGATRMKQRFSGKQFRHFLAFNQTLFGTYLEITKLKADGDALKRNASTLEQQASSAQHRANMLEAGVTKPREQAIDLYNQKVPPAEIARRLEENPNTVKSWIRRYKDSLKEEGAE